MGLRSRRRSRRPAAGAAGGRQQQPAGSWGSWAAAAQQRRLPEGVEAQLHHARAALPVPPAVSAARHGTRATQCCPAQSSLIITTCPHTAVHRRPAASAAAPLSGCPRIVGCCPTAIAQSPTFSSACLRARCSCGPELLASLFKVDVSSDLLAQLLLALAAGAQLLAQQEQAQQQCDAGFILRALQALTTAGRFGLNVRLLGGKVQAAVRQMFSDISSCLPSSREAAAMPEGGAAGDGAAAAAEGPGALELAAKLQRLYGAA